MPPSWCAPRPAGSTARSSALLTVMKGLPLAYQKDMQEDKVPVFEASDALELCLAATTGMVRDMQPDRDRLRAVAGRGFSTATDLADWLVRTLDMPFRRAHHVTGEIVKRAEARGCTLAELPLADFQASGAANHRRGLRRARCRSLGRQPDQLWRHRAGAGARGRRGAATPQVSGIEAFPPRIAIAVLLLLGLALAGMRQEAGDPKPPPDEPNTYPRVYPSA